MSLALTDTQTQTALAAVRTMAARLRRSLMTSEVRQCLQQALAADQAAASRVG